MKSGEVDPEGGSKVTWGSARSVDPNMDGLSLCSASAWCLESARVSQGTESPFFGSFFDSTHRTHFSYHLPTVANGTNLIRRLVPDCRVTSHLVRVFHGPGAH